MVVDHQMRQKWLINAQQPSFIFFSFLLIWRAKWKTIKHPLAISFWIWIFLQNGQTLILSLWMHFPRLLICHCLVRTRHMSHGLSRVSEQMGHRVLLHRSLSTTIAAIRTTSTVGPTSLTWPPTKHHQHLHNHVHNDRRWLQNPSQVSASCRQKGLHYKAADDSAAA